MAYARITFTGLSAQAHIHKTLHSSRRSITPRRQMSNQPEARFRAGTLLACDGAARAAGLIAVRPPIGMGGREHALTDFCTTLLPGWWPATGAPPGLPAPCCRLGPSLLRLGRMASLDALTRLDLRAPILCACCRSNSRLLRLSLSARRTASLYASSFAARWASESSENSRRATSAPSPSSNACATLPSSGDVSGVCLLARRRLRSIEEGVSIHWSSLSVSARFSDFSLVDSTLARGSGRKMMRDSEPHPIFPKCSVPQPGPGRVVGMPKACDFR